MNTTTAILSLAACCLTAAVAQSDEPQVLTKGKKGQTVVNTTSLAQDVLGYMGPTPLLITISKGKVTKVEPLPNDETPRYIQFVTEDGLFERWDGMSLKEAAEADVDATTGATMTSKAVMENVRRGVKYYLEHK